MKITEGWIWSSNLAAFLESLAAQANYQLLTDEIEIIQAGVKTSNSNTTPPCWYEYSFEGQEYVQLKLGYEQGTDVIIVQAKVPTHLGERVDFLLELMSYYTITRR